MRGGAARRVVLACGLLLVLGSLFAFKYYDFVAAEFEHTQALGDASRLPRLGLVAPAGYSFYAFSAASLLIDAFARRLPEGGHRWQVALYLAWFPKILAGPIERATGLLPQWAAGLRADPERVVLGLQLMLWGLFKKVVIADNLAPIVDKSFGIAAFASPVELLLSVYFFAFQIYCDFSGYTDIAIGVSLLFGLSLWRTSAGPICRAARPSSGVSVGTSRSGVGFAIISMCRWAAAMRARCVRYINLMLVFLASGLWHAGLGYGIGWTFLVWGALNGAYQWVGVATPTGLDTPGRPAAAASPLAHPGWYCACC